MVTNVAPVGNREKMLFERLIGRRNGPQSRNKRRKKDQAAYVKQESHGQ